MFDQRRFWAGDDQYFEGLLSEYGATVLAIARSFGSDAEHAADLFQEVWQQVYAKRRSFDGTGSLGAWLHRVATNVCITDYRARKARSTTRERFQHQSPSEGSGSGGSDLLSSLERRELHAALHRAMGELSERQQTTVVLRFMEDRDSAEIAEIMGTSAATVRSNLRHALTKLRNIMAGEDDDLS